MMRTEVHLSGHHAANIDREDGSAADQLTLTYTDAWASASGVRYPMSVSMPFQQRKHQGERVGRWIAGLLPSNRRMLLKWQAEFNADSASPLDLLRTPLGLDCAGAVQFCPEGDSGTLAPGGVHWLSEDDMVAEVLRMSASSEDWGGSSDRGAFSLPGAYAKKAVLLDDAGVWGEALGGTPSTHIVKPEPDNTPGLAVGEFVGLRSAALVGLPAASAELSSVGGHPVLVVERFDRFRQPGGDVGRVHQEDFQQALSVPGIYQADGGPHLEQYGQVLQGRAARSSQGAEHLFKQFAWRWIICDVDGHAKNSSLQISAGGELRLAPMYDVWPVAVLPEARQMTHEEMLANYRMAVYADGLGTLLEAHKPAAWEDMGQALGLTSRQSQIILQELMDAAEGAVEAALGEVPADLQGDTCEMIADLIEERKEDWAHTFPRSRSTGSTVADAVGKRLASGGLPPFDAPRCGKWMPNARTTCQLPEGHPHHCQSLLGTQQ